MGRLDELPHRFWPSSRLPPGVEVWPKFMNLKAVLEKLIAGDPDLTLTAADRAEHMRMMQMMRMMRMMQVGVSGRACA